MILPLLKKLAHDAAPLLDVSFKDIHPPKIDLSIQNIASTGAKIYETEILRNFVTQRRRLMNAPMVWGGYLEHRLIYSNAGLFHQESHPRNIHLGLDFWMDAQSPVYSPLAGTVHSFQDNRAFHDYGPTIILQHKAEGLTFHSLYGHLSQQSLLGLEAGMPIAQGQRIAWLGEEAENGQWPPHLHFQLIVSMQGKQGDYPGACAVEDLKFYTANCPDPRFLLSL